MGTTPNITYEVLQRDSTETPDSLSRHNNGVVIGTYLLMPTTVIIYIAHEKTEVLLIAL